MATARPHRCGEAHGDSFAADLAELVARARSYRQAIVEARQVAARDHITASLELARIDRCPTHGDWRHDERCDLCDAHTASKTAADRRTLYDVAVA